MKRTAFLLVAIILNMGPWATADLIQWMPGKSVKSARGFDVEADLRNDEAKFAVRVAVDREDRTYEQGELMKVTVKSQRSGHLYLLYRQANGSAKCLFPNLYESDNKIRGGSEITIPTPKQGFQLRCNKPFGDELLMAIVTQRPIAVEKLGVKSLTKSVATDIDLKTFVRGIRKGMEVVGSGGKPGQWAEHSVLIKTVAQGGRGRAVSQQQRFVLVVGISDYQDPRIRDLSVCHKDAAAILLALKKHGNLNGYIALLEKNATRAKVQKAFEELKAKSNPGDEIIIYWSGHGGTFSDTDGDEDDGYDEFLVPYDADTKNMNKTVVSDDALGRWVQQLDGRKVVVIFDACHSGGVAEGKGLTGGIKGNGLLQSADDIDADSADELLKALQDDNSGGTSNFVIGGPRRRSDGREFMGDVMDRLQNLRTKDIRAQDAVMLLSCQADEISAERRDGTLSVMTYSLIEKIESSNSLTLEGAYNYVKVEVPKYMKKHFPGRTQTPQLCPKNSGDDVTLR